MNATRFARLACGLLVGIAVAGHAAPRAGVPASIDTSRQIEIRSFAFVPKQLVVPTGTRVRWTNRDEEPHIVVSAGKGFVSSPALDTDDTYVVTFAKPGTYAYYCSIHPFMVGTIVVQ